MRKFTLVIAALLCVGWASAQGSNFTPENGKFSVRMPCPQPSKKVDKQDTPVGEVTSTTFHCKEGPFEYAVTYTDLPSLAVVFRGEDEIYASARSKLLDKFQGRKRSWNDTTVGARGGKSMSYDIPNPRGEADRIGLARLILISDRLYLINAIGPKNSEPDLKAFLDSFRYEGS